MNVVIQNQISIEHKTSQKIYYWNALMRKISNFEKCISLRKKMWETSNIYFKNDFTLGNNVMT